jgi:hypothetical protein
MAVADRWMVNASTVARDGRIMALPIEFNDILACLGLIFFILVHAQLAAFTACGPTL